MIVQNDSIIDKDGKKVINEKVQSKIQETIQIDDIYDFKFLIKIDDYNIDCTIEKQSLNNLVRVCVNGIFSSNKQQYNTDETIDKVVQSVSDILRQTINSLYDNDVQIIDFEMKLTKLLQNVVYKQIKALTNIIQNNIDVENVLTFSQPYQVMQQ